VVQVHEQTRQMSTIGQRFGQISDLQNLTARGAAQPANQPRSGSAPGDWPYTFNSKRELLNKVMKGDLERHPMTLAPDVPPWLDAIVARSLALKREDRFESALAMKAALEKGAPPEKSGLLRRLFGG